MKLSKIFKLSYLLRIGRLVKYMASLLCVLDLLVAYSDGCRVCAEGLLQISPPADLLDRASLPEYVRAFR